MIISFVFCAWGTHAGAIQDRQDVDFNLVLTVVAFKIFLGDMLPPVSYVTKMDIYVMVGFLFLVAITVVHTTLPYTVFAKIDLSAITLAPDSMPGDTEQQLLDRDDLSFYVFLILWLSWNLIFTIWLKTSANREFNAFVDQAKKDQAEFNAFV